MFKITQLNFNLYSKYIRPTNDIKRNLISLIL